MDLATVFDTDALERLETELLGRAFLYETPQTYRETVEEIFDALRSMIALRIGNQRTATA